MGVFVVRCNGSGLTFPLFPQHRCVAATDACTRQLIGWMTQHSSDIEHKFWALGKAIAEKCCDTR
jgi:hypothetical protein